MVPTAIIFINADLNDTATKTLQSQLEINDTMSFSEFNARVQVDPNYPFNVHAQGLRILVILPTLHDMTNRTLADIVLFFNQGQVTVEKSNFGPPGLSLPIARLNIYELLRYNNSPGVVILPHTLTQPCGTCCETCGLPGSGACCKCNSCGYPFKTCNCPNRSHPGIGGIVVDQLADSSGVYCPNPDNEYNNPDFINRK